MQQDDVKAYAIYAGGFLGGLLLGWASERYSEHLQARIVIGWCEEFTRLAAQ